MHDRFVKIIFGAMLVTIALIVWPLFKPSAGTIKNSVEPPKPTPQKTVSAPKEESKVSKVTQTKPQKKQDEEVAEVEIEEVTDYFAVGEAAVKKSNKVLFAEIEFLFEDNSENAALLKDGRLKELFINAMAQPDSPDSHYYMAMIEFQCMLNGNEADRPPAYEDLDSERFEGISDTQRQLYEGYNSGLKQAHKSFSSECVEVNSLKENNQAFIQSRFQETFGKESFMKLFNAVLEDEKEAEMFFSKTSIKPTPLLKESIAFETKLKSDQDDIKNKAYKDLMKRSLENPDIYLAQKVCAFRSKCQKLVGEEEYMAYLKNGAQFGTRGTLSKYVRELKRSDKNVEALAWNKYNQAITRSGCALGTFVYSDMQITKENKELNSKLSEEEKQKSEALYQEIRNQYFESATKKLGCG